MPIFWPLKGYEYLRTSNSMMYFLLFFFSQHLQIVVTEEVLAYTIEDLVADFGGYLGLLLGASILSMYDFITQIKLK